MVTQTGSTHIVISDTDHVTDSIIIEVIVVIVMTKTHNSVFVITVKTIVGDWAISEGGHQVDYGATHSGCAVIAMQGWDGVDIHVETMRIDHIRLIVTWMWSHLKGMWTGDTSWISHVDVVSFTGLTTVDSGVIIIDVHIIDFNGKIISDQSTSTTNGDFDATVVLTSAYYVTTGGVVRAAVLN